MANNKSIKEYLESSLENIEMIYREIGTPPKDLIIYIKNALDDLENVLNHPSIDTPREYLEGHDIRFKKYDDHDLYDIIKRLKILNDYLDNENLKKATRLTRQNAAFVRDKLTGMDGHLADLLEDYKDALRIQHRQQYRQQHRQHRANSRSKKKSMKKQNRRPRQRPRQRPRPRPRPRSRRRRQSKKKTM